MQPRETVIVDAADLVVPQHPKDKSNKTLQLKHLKYCLTSPE